ncbi:MAG TPA: hypothetical protein VGI90_19875 [Steroidobacteraceae bacterium]
MPRAAVLLAVLTMSPLALAQEAPSWVAFDAKYPGDFIDSKSIVSPSNGIVRFWERAGFAREVSSDGKIGYAQYTLVEMNCSLKQSRVIKWEYALEEHTAAAMAARAKFYKSMAGMKIDYPTAWESIEPVPHAYALHDFVCRANKP